jgi:YbgC/YbaW family acyl-CoA thioester hydrolase
MEGNPRAAQATVSVTVEFEDVDSYMIGHHTKLIAYLERARVRLFEGAGIGMAPGRINPVIHDLRIRFRKTVALLDKLEVTAFARSMDAYRLKLGYGIRRGGVLVARASTDLAFVDTETGEPVPVPREYDRLVNGDPAQ